MNKACSYCGRVHPMNYRCPKKPKRIPTAAEYAERKRGTQKWKNLSLRIREDSHYLCAVCMDRNQRLNSEALEVHHITPIRENPEGVYEPDNLVCLCSYHHELAERGFIDRDYLRRLAQEREESCKLFYTFPPAT